MLKSIIPIMSIFVEANTLNWAVHIRHVCERKYSQDVQSWGYVYFTDWIENKTIMIIVVNIHLHNLKKRWDRYGHTTMICSCRCVCLFLCMSLRGKLSHIWAGNGNIEVKQNSTYTNVCRSLTRRLEKLRWSTCRWPFGVPRIILARKIVRTLIFIGCFSVIRYQEIN